MRSPFGLEGKRILVLGGGMGMGEATVRLIAAHGAHVAVVDREMERAQLVASAIAEGGDAASAYCIDVVDDAALVAGIDRIEAEFGPLDGMATVIGMAAWGSLLELDMATWDEDQARNLRYFFLAAREVARAMIVRKAAGSIVCVGSVNGLRSAPHHGAYGAAKAGLVNLVSTMATEWSPFGIRVNCVAPGPIITPRIPHTGAEGERKMMVNVPMHRRGTVEDIAKAITFFLSDLSPYVTGQVLAVDGGSLATNPFIPLADGHAPRRMTLPPERPGHAAAADLIARREGLAGAVAAGYFRCASPSDEVLIGGVRVLRFAPAGAPRAIAMHIHGGAFRIGCPEMIARFAEALAECCGVTVFCPAYRLAPEHPFPSALRDCHAVLTRLAQQYPELPIFLSGDSAGGGLAASLASGFAPPLAGLALLSPWLDLTVCSASYAANAANDPLFSADAAREAAGLYLQGVPAREPLVSPLFASVSGLPPTFLNVGSGEVLLDDALGFSERLRLEGVGAHLSVVEGMDHVAATRDLASPGAAQAFADLSAFIEDALAPR